MRLRKYFERKPGQRTNQRARSRNTSGSIAGHRLFVPMLTIWGAALMGLAVIVLPASSIARITTLSGLGMLGSMAQFILAGIAALLGGGIGFVIGAAFRDRTTRAEEKLSVVSVVSSRRVRPIDPAIELGSESLDAPIESMPFGVEEDSEFEELDEASQPQPTLGELSQRGYDIEAPMDCAAADEHASGEQGFTRSQFKNALIETCEGATCEAAPAEKPRALDLGEFAELPGRNAVWVEEEAEAEAVQASAESGPKTKAKPVLPTNALEKLRQTAPENLSLVQMVERFAGALHDHQQAERASLPKNGLGRDTALAEALKALTLFTERGFDQASPQSINAGDGASAGAGQGDLGHTERELRAALVKLQTLRGAA